MHTTRIRSFWICAWTGLALAGICVAMTAAADTADPIATAEDMVRATWYEGLPYQRARTIGDAGAQRLAEMLFDPAEWRHRANIALALGMAARPGAYRAIATAAAGGSSGEVDVAEFRFQLTVPIAMGHLARHDDRALAWLAAPAGGRAADPGWSYRHLSGQRLADLLRGAAIQGLGLSARSDALELLDAISVETTQHLQGNDPELPSLLRDARATHARITGEGAGAALSDKSGRAMR